MLQRSDQHYSNVLDELLRLAKSFTALVSVDRYARSESLITPNCARGAMELVLYELGPCQSGRVLKTFVIFDLSMLQRCQYGGRG